MSDLKPGALVSIVPFARAGRGPHRKMALMGTVIDGPFYQEPTNRSGIGRWSYPRPGRRSYKILCYGSIRYVDAKHVEPFDETD